MSVNEQSERLKLKWMQTVVEGKCNNYTGNGVERELKVRQRIILKMIWSMRDISVEYGSVGIVTKATSRYYLHSLMADTGTLILGVREIGALM